jgi:formimidoylglutamate deiminase
MQALETPAPSGTNTVGHNPRVFWAARAWLGAGAAAHWAVGVCLEVDTHGHWSAISTGLHTPPAHATVLAGPVLPGMVDAHSHAFQRAFAGLAERRASDADDFWSWRDRMYGVALRTTPQQMRAIATQLYIELLQGGYTQVCEFHYLHHQRDGTPHADPAAMAWALADAAQDAGIGLTLLPVLYERAGFAHAGLRKDQRRFASSPGFVADLQRAVQGSGRTLLHAGVAIHSLRAASAASIGALLAAVGDADLPIHIHVAEQMQEVHDCLAAHGQRPIAWLAAQGLLDARWQLVHATHSEPTEIEAVARSGAGTVICPSTEANLGDGLADIPGWLQANVPMAIGSDSQVCRQWAQELRWLEYGQRLQLQRRNVAAAPAQGQSATAARLFDAATRAGGAAAGLGLWGLQVGARADMVVLDHTAPGLLGVPASHTLDALVFGCDSAAVRDVFVAGHAVLCAGKHAYQAQASTQFLAAMDALWHGTVLE